MYTYTCSTINLKMHLHIRVLEEKIVYNFPKKITRQNLPMFCSKVTQKV